MGITCFGGSEKAEEASMMKWLREQVDEERGQGSKHVHMHASCPCTAGSSRSLSGNGNYDFHFAELEEIVKRLPEYEKIADGTSLDWLVAQLVSRFLTRYTAGGSSNPHWSASKTQVHRTLPQSINGRPNQKKMGCTGRLFIVDFAILRSHSWYR